MIRTYIPLDFLVTSMSIQAIADTDDCEKANVTVVLPCLNESETLTDCIGEIRTTLAKSGLSAEIIVSDNGSVDDSVAIAVALGARVVHASPKGYGVALSEGIAAATAELVVMGDADGSYDFGDIPLFVEKLLEGFDVVIGNRFRGGVMPGAMPWSHRWIGNPVLTAIGKLFFRCPIGDFHCGLRAIRKEAFTSLRLDRPGMEFASEMIVRSKLAGLRMAEIPTTLRPDGRSRPPHLRSFSDGWRHLRFMLFFCPIWLFIIPGAFLTITGGTLQLILAIVGEVHFNGIHYGINTSLAAAAMIFLGLQLVGSGFLVLKRGQSTGLLPAPEPEAKLNNLAMEHGLAASFFLIGMGTILFLTALNHWRTTAFGDLPPDVTIRRVIPSVILVTIGSQSTFFMLLTSTIRFMSANEVSLNSSSADHLIDSA